MAGGVYTGGGATVVMNPPPVVFVQVFHPASGPERHLKRKAESVAVLARALAPVSSGRMASTIRVAQNRNEAGTRFSFGFNVNVSTPYAVYVHEGTGPSVRFPNNRQVMKFPGLFGKAAYSPIVVHPGNAAQPFLQNALVAMAG